MTEISFDSRNDFKEFIKSNAYVFARVSAKWCGPCKKINPLINKQIKELPQDIKIVYIDYDKHRDVASFLKIKNVPTFLFFTRGNPDICLVGANPENVMKFFKQMAYKVENK